MQLKDLDFIYPEELVATERAAASRVMFVANGDPCEFTKMQLIEQFQNGDLLVINNTQVLKRRVFSEAGLEILFLRQRDHFDWDVLCPSSRWKPTDRHQVLPGGLRIELIERGRPQVVRTNLTLDEDYFQEFGEMPLPPYIQKARGERHNRTTDKDAYQTAWAQKPGSLAAPTASLHFSQVDLEELRAKGVQISELTLHVGLGTFLPITTENLDAHPMHAEIVEIPETTWRAIQATKQRKGCVWALGTTVMRALESAAIGKIPAPGIGETDLFIRPGFEFQIVDALLTNFHQPQSTLLALVGAFAGLDNVKRTYAWAIERQFRLFSYGDLTAWINSQSRQT